MNKKAIAILGAIFLLIVGTLGFLLYTKYKSNNNTTTPPGPIVDKNQSSTTPDNTGDGGNNPATTTPANNSSSPFVKLSGDQVISPAIFYNGNGVTYFDTSGTLYQADFNSSDWMPNGDKIIFIWADQGKSTINMAGLDRIRAYHLLPRGVSKVVGPD